MIFTINSLGLFSEKSWNWEKAMVENAKRWDKCFTEDINRGISLHGTGCVNISKLNKHLKNNGLVINSIDLPEILSWKKCFKLILQDINKRRMSCKQLKRRIGYKILNISTEEELARKIGCLLDIKDIKYIRCKSDSLFCEKELILIENVLDKRLDICLAVEIDEVKHKFLEDYIRILEKINRKYTGRVYISFDTGHFFYFAGKMGWSLSKLIEELAKYHLKVGVIELNQVAGDEKLGWHRIPWEKDAKINVFEIITQLKKSGLLLENNNIEIVTEIYPWFLDELVLGMSDYAKTIKNNLEK